LTGAFTGAVSVTTGADSTAAGFFVFFVGAAGVLTTGVATTAGAGRGDLRDALGASSTTVGTAAGAGVGWIFFGAIGNSFSNKKTFFLESIGGKNCARGC